MNIAKDQAHRLWRRAMPRLRRPAAALQRVGLDVAGRAAAVPAAVAVAGVYRARNSDYLSTLIAQLSPRARFALHALDAVHPELSRWTVSQGPGQRMALLNQLIEALDPRVEEYVCIADDDVTFLRGPLAPTRSTRLVGLGAAAGLDIFQPAHGWGSQATFAITRQEPLSVVRLTRFVESGPLVVFSPRARARVIPFASRFRMGWGADVAWSRLADEGLRLGVVDATPIVHHGRVGAAYDNAAEADIAAAEAEAAGVRTAHDLATNLGLTWRPWQRRPKWITP